ncbi:MAG TPA: DUF885 domain-containing protein [Blastocatellia bacterium]|nr:DUF885 domain-containing protein [Blastocatellia bacterium]
MGTLFLMMAVAMAAPIQRPVRGVKSMPSSASSRGDRKFVGLSRAYTVEFLRRFPVVNTYLGGAGLDAALAEADGRLRDHSAAALVTEDRWLEKEFKAFELTDPTALSPALRIDREVALAQIRFLLHQHQVRRYQERALDTYTDEPFRAVDWQLQGMTQTGEKTYGTAEEWELVATRVGAIPGFLSVARDQLLAGIKHKNTPDFRVLRRNGIDTAEADAAYFEKTLPALANARVSGPGREKLVSRINEACAKAAAAYRELKDFIGTTFFVDLSLKGDLAVKPEFRGDRFQMGEHEYDWALRNNFRVNKTSAQLYAESWPIVQATSREMVELARDIGKEHNWNLPAEGTAAVRAVFDQLSKDYPKSDDEMVGWYRDTAFRLVDYARKTGIFDVPAGYKLEVTETPPPLRASIDGAAYYPAPPFKTSGVGRFYVTPTDNDPAALQANNRSALADLAAHEGFPGHDWHYKVMTEYRDEISPIRWLTPGAVEDSSSMWEDSMAAEGWALYAESLMAEPQPRFAHGFYTPEEHLYQLQGKLYRDLRVRIDTGIHTHRMSYDDAVDLFSQVVDFLPGSCKDAAAIKNDAKRASCDSAERAIFRYSKWPTQAITYRLGKDEILALRTRATQEMGKQFLEKAFHLRFMRQGTIPAGYFGEELLREMRTR